MRLDFSEIKLILKNFLKVLSEKKDLLPIKEDQNNIFYH
jgi:hypothetical protein